MPLPFFPLIGLDFGSSALKLVEFSGHGRARKLSAIGIELLPKDAITDGVIQDSAAVEAALFSLLERLRINPRGRRVAISLPSSITELKRVLIDADSPDFNDVVRFEAEQYFQASMDDLYFQHETLNSWSEDVSKAPVLLVGAHREPVDQYIDVVRNCGLRIGVIDCAALSLTNIFEYCFPQANALTAIVDVGAKITDVNIVFNGQYLYSKKIAIGGDFYTEQLAHSLMLSHEQAEIMKLAVCSGEAAPPEPWVSVVTGVNASLIEEVGNAFKSYFESSRPIPGVSGLSHILLVGGGSRIISFDQELSASLKIPVQHFNAMQAIAANPKIFSHDYLRVYGTSYAVACGAALRKFGDERAERKSA